VHCGETIGSEKQVLCFEPIPFVPFQCHVESHDVLNLTTVDCTVANRSARGDKSVQKGVILTGFGRCQTP
jgi:hypothetical protein